MHELSLTQDILDAALEYARQADAKKVVIVVVRLGALRDIQKEWLRHYFSFIRKDTIAAEAEILVLESPIAFRCRVCGKEFEVDREKLAEEDVSCPGCSAKNYELISGTEFRIEGIEVA